MQNLHWPVTFSKYLRLIHHYTLPVMKKITAKTGMLLTLLLVSAMLVFGFVSNNKSSQADDCSATEKSSSGEVQSKLNLKGMTRHLLDFYK